MGGWQAITSKLALQGKGQIAIIGALASAIGALLLPNPAQIPYAHQTDFHAGGYYYLALLTADEKFKRNTGPSNSPSYLPLSLIHVLQSPVD
jgi:hypothetical protein